MVIREILPIGIESLKEAGIADAEVDAFLLFEAVTGLRRTEYLLYPNKEIAEPQFDRYLELLLRRASHEPCQYIIGHCEFYGVDLLVNENVLIPRQDTELLVEKALLAAGSEADVLDLCTGSGAVAIALKAQRPDLKILASDISEAALKVAEENAKRNCCDIRFLRSDLFSEIDPEMRFDLIVSNPPYVTDAEYETLMPEVKDHEPELALKAGKEGLDIYRRLIAEAPSFLKPGGALAVEIGFSQAEAVSKLYEDAGFQTPRVFKDLAGLDRVVFGRLPMAMQNENM